MLTYSRNGEEEVPMCSILPYVVLVVGSSGGQQASYTKAYDREAGPEGRR
jgi:hypothetical protein